MTIDERLKRIAIHRAGWDINEVLDAQVYRVLYLIRYFASHVVLGIVSEVSMFSEYRTRLFGRPSPGLLVFCFVKVEKKTWAAVPQLCDIEDFADSCAIYGTALIRTV